MIHTCGKLTHSYSQTRDVALWVAHSGLQNGFIRRNFPMSLRRFPTVEPVEHPRPDCSRTPFQVRSVGRHHARILEEIANHQVAVQGYRLQESTQLQVVCTRSTTFCSLAWQDAEGLASSLIGPPSRKGAPSPPGMWPIRVNWPQRLNQRSRLFITADWLTRRTVRGRTAAR